MYLVKDSNPYLDIIFLNSEILIHLQCPTTRTILNDHKQIRGMNFIFGALESRCLTYRYLVEVSETSKLVE